jgi:hypothetical protein
MTKITQSELHAKSDIGKSSCMEDCIYLKNKEIHFCPICGKELVYSGDRNLETMNEHVGDPNGKPALKFCFMCGYKCCLANKLLFGWGSDGDLYCLGDFFGIEQIKFKDDITSSIGSWQRKYDEKIAWEKSRTFEIKFGKFEAWNWRLMLEFFIPNNPLHWSVSIWWKGIWVMSIPETIQYKIRKFIKDRRKIC